MTEKAEQIIAETYPETKDMKLTDTEQILLLKIKGALKQYQEAKNKYNPIEDSNKQVSEETLEQKFQALYGSAIVGMDEASINQIRQEFIKEQQTLDSTATQKQTLEQTLEEKFQANYGTVIDGMSKEDIEIIRQQFIKEQQAEKNQDVTDEQEYLTKRNFEEHDLSTYMPLLTSAKDLCNLYNHTLKPDYEAYLQDLNEGKIVYKGDINITIDPKTGNIKRNSPSVTDEKELAETKREIYGMALQTLFANDYFFKDSSLKSEDTVLNEIERTGNAKALKQILDYSPAIQQIMSRLHGCASFDFGHMMGQKWQDSENKDEIQKLIHDHPKETLALVYGAEDTVIHGLGDLKAKLELPEVKAMAAKIQITDLTASIKKLQQEPLLKGMDKAKGIGGEFKEPMAIVKDKKISGMAMKG